MTSKSDNLKAGVFVLIGFILSLMVVFSLTDFERLFEKKQDVTVFYRLSDGLKGLTERAVVTLGGQPIGEVVRIRNSTEGEMGRVVGKLVTVKIPDRFHVFDNAVFELDVPTIGSGTKLNIRSVGSGKAYDPGKSIDGSIARSELTRQFAENMGIEDLQRTQIQEIIVNVKDLSITLKEDVPRLSARLQEAVRKLEPMLDEVHAGMTDLRAAVASVRSFTADMDERREKWFGRIDSISGAADETMASVRDLIKDKDPALRQSVDNVTDITQRVRREMMAKVEEALDKAVQAVENVKKSSAELKAFVVGQRPVLERALANAQLTTAQLKLAAIEIRRSPWRLLYEPDDKELETDNLYDAARSFALAAGTLDATAQSLQALTGQQPQDREHIQKMLDYLEALFTRFEDAENSFWEALKGQPGQQGRRE